LGFAHGLQVMMFEEEFALDIPDADAEKIFTAEDAVSYILAHQ
jgi:acyl carrier protein